MKITINRDEKTPVYIQIANQIRRQIEAGEIPAGQRLPSERKLAESLGVNRTTILNAYSELKAEGLLGSFVGNGTVVQNVKEETITGAAKRNTEPVWHHLFSQYSERIESSLVKELLELASRTDFISFATGIAAPDSGPIEIISGLEEALHKPGNIRALLHSPTEGFLSLRRTMCSVMQKRGVFCSPEEMMMLSGSQQGIDLAARIFLDPGDIVVIEEPTYFPAIQVFKAAGARIMTVPVDENGMKVDVLEQLLQRYRPKMVYTIPTYQNPTGTEMSMERRQRLLALSSRYNVLILEDDAYGDLCYEGAQLPLLKALDTNGSVIYLSTFSKNVYSGLRLGWIVADKKIIKAFASCKQLADLHSSSLSQWLIEQFIQTGLDAHTEKVCAEYKIRRDMMLGALAKYAPSGLSWSKPKGGYYIWCRLPQGISANTLVSKAAAYKVSFIPGGPFFYAESGDAYIRLNFTYAPIEDIEKGISLLCKAMKELMSDRLEISPACEYEVNPIV